MLLMLMIQTIVIIVVLIKIMTAAVLEKKYPKMRRVESCDANKKITAFYVMWGVEEIKDEPVDVANVYDATVTGTIYHEVYMGNC